MVAIPKKQSIFMRTAIMIKGTMIMVAVL